MATTCEPTGWLQRGSFKWLFPSYKEGKKMQRTFDKNPPNVLGFFYFFIFRPPPSSSSSSSSSTSSSSILPSRWFFRWKNSLTFHSGMNPTPGILLLARNLSPFFFFFFFFYLFIQFFFLLFLRFIRLPFIQSLFLIHRMISWWFCPVWRHQKWTSLSHLKKFQMTDSLWHKSTDIYRY